MRQKLSLTLLVIMIFCTACGDSGGDSDIPTTLTVEEVQTALEKKSYENMDILFNDMDNFTGQPLIEAYTETYDFAKHGGLSMREILDVYVEDIYPSLLGGEPLDRSILYDQKSRTDSVNGEPCYTKNYSQILATIDEYTIFPDLAYWDKKYNRKLNFYADGSSVEISCGGLGSYAGTPSPWMALGQIEEGKSYDCRTDDLSDSYMLPDGEKTVAEAKAEMEQYLDEHYPLGREKNGINNEITTITAGKIRGTEYFAFCAERTFSYNGIPFRQDDGGSMEKEFLIIAECAMCETGKVDVTTVIINFFTEPEVRRAIKEYIPFAEVLERVSYYLTGETRFQLIYGGMEYRLFYEDDGYQMIPYWMFIAKDPNDDSMIKIYVDIETGEVEHMDYGVQDNSTY